MAHTHPGTRPTTGQFAAYKVGSGPHRGATAYGRIVKIENPSSYRGYRAYLDSGVSCSPADGDVLTFCSDVPVHEIALREQAEAFTAEKARAEEAHGEAVCEMRASHAEEIANTREVHRRELEEARVAFESDKRRFGAAERAYRLRLERLLFGTRIALAAAVVLLAIVAWTWTPLPALLVAAYAA